MAAPAAPARRASASTTHRRPARPARSWTVSPGAFRVVALLTVWALALTIISGAAVRLTGSGLGCSTWPSCTHSSVVAPWRLHAWIEFGNRLINAVVTVAAIGVFVAALRRRPRRRDLTWLSAGMVVGLLLEVAMGAVVVYSGLNPVMVSLHFLLGLAFLALAVVLHHRAGRAGEPAPRVPLVQPWQEWLARVMLLALTVVVTLGTVVTSTGPHGGNPRAPRFHFSLHSVAQLHGASVETFLAITLAMLWSLAHTGAPRPVIRRAQIMLVVLAAQAGVGYAQYLSGDPVAVVAVHVAGASLVVIAVLRFYLGLWSHLPAGGPVPTGSIRPAAGAVGAPGPGLADPTAPAASPAGRPIG